MPYDKLSINLCFCYFQRLPKGFPPLSLSFIHLLYFQNRETVSPHRIQKSFSLFSNTDSIYIFSIETARIMFRLVYLNLDSLKWSVLFHFGQNCNKYLKVHSMPEEYGLPQKWPKVKWVISASALKTFQIFPVNKCIEQIQICFCLEKAMS